MQLFVQYLYNMLPCEISEMTRMSVVAFHDDVKLSVSSNCDDRAFLRFSWQHWYISHTIYRIHRSDLRDKSCCALIIDT